MRAIRRRGPIVVAAVLLAMLFVPSPAYADMGPPIFWIAFGLLSVLVAEAAVVLIETPILRRLLSVSYPRAFLASLGANAVSALLGIPVSVGAGALLLSRLISVDVSSRAQDGLSILVVVAASFACSSLVEWPLVKLIARRDWKPSGIAVLVANAVSHSVLLAIGALFVIRTGA